VVGDDAYTYENLLPYFKKGIHYNPPNNTLRPNNASVPAVHDAFSHGSGTVHVSTSDNWVNPISSYVNAAWKALGAPVAHDFVSGTLSGVQYAMNTINPRGNTRSSSYSFLESVGDATFIRVYNNTLAKQIIFRGNEAVGALVTSSGNDYVLFARKEVILSAGAVRFRIIRFS
jgi:choline dehydrogenase